MNIETNKTDDFTRLVNLLQAYSGLSVELAGIETSLNNEHLDMVRQFKASYAEAQSKLGLLEGALEDLSRAHPEWFKDKKSVKTPFGAVKFHASTELEIGNEEATILLLEQEERLNEDFDAALYLKTEVTVNKEALEELDDATLKRFRVKRVPKENFSVVPVKVDMGKAVKDADAKEAKAEARKAA